GISEGSGRVREALTDSIQGGVKSAASSGPVGLAIAGGLIAAIAAAAPAVATAIGSALTLGFGSSFVGFGIAILAENKKIKKSIEDTFKDVKSILSDAFRPLEPIIHTTLGLIKDLSKEFAPFIKQAS